MFKHIRHESKRFASEIYVDEDGRQHTARSQFCDPRGSCGVLPPKTPYMHGMRAAGVLAYQTLYTEREGIKPRKPGKPFLMEELYQGRAGLWVTCDREFQRHFQTMQQAVNFANAHPKYRVVRMNNVGAYDPVGKCSGRNK